MLLNFLFEGGNGRVFYDHDVGGLDGLVRGYHRIMKKDFGTSSGVIEVYFSNLKFKCLPELDGTFTIVSCKSNKAVKVYKNLKSALNYMEKVDS